MTLKARIVAAACLSLWGSRLALAADDDANLKCAGASFFDGSAMRCNAAVVDPTSASSVSGGRTANLSSTDNSIETPRVSSDGPGAAPIPAHSSTKVRGDGWKAPVIGGPPGGGNAACESTPYKEGANQDFMYRFINNSFWHDALDQLCKPVQIPGSVSFDTGFGVHAQAGVQRSMTSLPPDKDHCSGQLAVVDQAQVDVAVAPPAALTYTAGTAVSLSASAGVGIEGRSLVVWPATYQNPCDELFKEMWKITTFKKVYPLHAGHFRDMAIGELWLMPMTLTANLGIPAGIPGFPPDGGTLSVSFGYSRGGGINVSLWRLSERELRVKIHIDHVRIIGLPAGASESIPAAQFNQFAGDSSDFFRKMLGVPVGTQLVAPAVITQIQNWINDFFTARIQWMLQWMSEDHVIIEFVLDPHNDDHMNGLEKLFAGQGKLNVLDGMLKRLKITTEAAVHMDDFTEKLLPEQEKNSKEALDEIARGFENPPAPSRFASASDEDIADVEKTSHDIHAFTAADRVKQKFLCSIPVSIRLPLVLDYSRICNDRDDVYTLFDGTGGKIYKYSAFLESDMGTIRLPFINNLANSNERTDVMAASRKNRDGLALAPFVVYIRQVGYTNQPEANVQKLPKSVDSIMSVLGVEGEGENIETALPSDQFPIQPPAKPPKDFGSGFGIDNLGSGYPPNPVAQARNYYRRGTGAFTLVLDEKAVEKIFSAPPKLVVKSYVRAMEDSPERQVMQWAVDNNQVSEDGNIKFAGLLRSPYWPGPEPYRQPEEFEKRLTWHLKTASKLAQTVRDIGAMRAPGSRDSDASSRQAGAIKKLIAGSVGAWFSYQKVMAVLAQLAPTDHVAAEFIQSYESAAKGGASRSGTPIFYNEKLFKEPIYTDLLKTANKFNPAGTYRD